MLGRIGSALRARPFLGACTSATVKTSAADVMVQTVIEGRGVDELDRRRLAGTRHRARTQASRGLQSSRPQAGLLLTHTWPAGQAWSVTHACAPRLGQPSRSSAVSGWARVSTCCTAACLRRCCPPAPCCTRQARCHHRRDHPRPHRHHHRRLRHRHHHLHPHSARQPDASRMPAPC